MLFASFRRIGGFPREQYAIAWLAHSYARLGRPEQALSMLNAALAHIENTGQKAEQAEILRLKGEVLLLGRRPRTAETEHCFRAALEVARAQEAKWWELRTVVTYAGLLRNTDRCDQAQTILVEIYDWFTEGFDTADLREVKLLLDELKRGPKSRSRGHQVIGCRLR